MATFRTIFLKTSMKEARHFLFFSIKLIPKLHFVFFLNMFLNGSKIIIETIRFHQRHLLRVLFTHLKNLYLLGLIKENLKNKLLSVGSAPLSHTSKNEFMISTTPFKVSPRMSPKNL